MSKNKAILLKGSSHLHVLYGEFSLSDDNRILVEKDSLLRHEKPNGNFAEHKGLIMESGKWEQGKQVEYNPFTRQTGLVWD